MTTQDLPDFSTCIISLHTRGATGATRLCEARWQEIGGRLFIIGKLTGDPDSPDKLSYCENGVAWDAVDDFLIFRSEDEYRRRMLPDAARRERLSVIATGRQPDSE